MLSSHTGALSAWSSTASAWLTQRMFQPQPTCPEALCTLARSWSRELVSSFSRDVKSRERAQELLRGQRKSCFWDEEACTARIVRTNDASAFLRVRVSHVEGREPSGAIRCPTHKVLGGQPVSNTKQTPTGYKGGALGREDSQGWPMEEATATEEPVRKTQRSLLPICWTQSAQSSVRESSGRWSC